MCLAAIAIALMPICEARIFQEERVDGRDVASAEGGTFPLFGFVAESMHFMKKEASRKKAEKARRTKAEKAFQRQAEKETRRTKAEKEAQKKPKPYTETKEAIVKKMVLAKEKAKKEAKNATQEVGDGDEMSSYDEEDWDGMIADIVESWEEDEAFDVTSDDLRSELNVDDVLDSFDKLAGEAKEHNKQAKRAKRGRERDLAVLFPDRDADRAALEHILRDVESDLEDNPDPRPAKHESFVVFEVGKECRGGMPYVTAALHSWNAASRIFQEDKIVKRTECNADVLPDERDCSDLCTDVLEMAILHVFNNHARERFPDLEANNLFGLSTFVVVKDGQFEKQELRSIDTISASIEKRVPSWCFVHVEEPEKSVWEKLNLEKSEAPPDPTGIATAFAQLWRLYSNAWIGAQGAAEVGERMQLKLAEEEASANAKMAALGDVMVAGMAWKEPFQRLLRGAFEKLKANLIRGRNKNDYVRGIDVTRDRIRDRNRGISRDRRNRGDVLPSDPQVKSGLGHLIAQGADEAAGGDLSPEKKALSRFVAQAARRVLEGADDFGSLPETLTWREHMELLKMVEPEGCRKASSPDWGNPCDEYAKVAAAEEESAISTLAMMHSFASLESELKALGDTYMQFNSGLERDTWKARRVRLRQPRDRRTMVCPAAITAAKYAPIFASVRDFKLGVTSQYASTVRRVADIGDRLLVDVHDNSVSVAWWRTRGWRGYEDPTAAPAKFWVTERIVTGPKAVFKNPARTRATVSAVRRALAKLREGELEEAVAKAMGKRATVRSLRAALEVFPDGKDAAQATKLEARQSLQERLNSDSPFMVAVRVKVFDKLRDEMLVERLENVMASLEHGAEYPTVPRQLVRRLHTLDLLDAAAAGALATKPEDALRDAVLIHTPNEQAIVKHAAEQIVVGGTQWEPAEVFVFASGQWASDVRRVARGRQRLRLSSLTPRRHVKALVQDVARALADPPLWAQNLRWHYGQVPTAWLSGPDGRTFPVVARALRDLSERSGSEATSGEDTAPMVAWDTSARWWKLRSTRTFWPSGRDMPTKLFNPQSYTPNAPPPAYRAWLGFWSHGNDALD